MGQRPFWDFFSNRKYSLMDEYNIIDYKWIKKIKLTNKQEHKLSWVGENTYKHTDTRESNLNFNLSNTKHEHVHII